MSIEKRDKSTLGNRVASAKRIAADMIPSITAKTFSRCFLRMHRHINSADHHLTITIHYLEFRV